MDDEPIIPSGFAPVPGETGIYFALGRDIPPTGRWERSDMLPQNHHERRWFRGPLSQEREAQSLNLAYVVRKATPLVETRPLTLCAGYLLVDSGRRIAYVKLWPDGQASYHDKDDMLLGKGDPQTRLRVAVKQNDVVDG